MHHRAGGEGFIMWRTELVTKHLPSVQLSPGLRGPEMHCRPTELPEPPTRFSALRQSPCGKPTFLSERPPPSRLPAGEAVPTLAILRTMYLSGDWGLGPGAPSALLMPHSVHASPLVLGLPREHLGCPWM